MGVLVTIIIVIASLVALLLIIALFVKSEYTIEREIAINQPLQKVFEYVKLIKNQDNYSVWNQLDPGMKKTYKGIDGTVGFQYAWDSNNKKAGKGEQQINAIKEGERIDTGLHFIKPFEGLADASITTAAISSGQTNVKWSVHSKMKYPMNIMLLVMNMEKMIGGDLASNLNNLKAVLEK